jgi:hypothetical protein
LNTRISKVTGSRDEDQYPVILRIDSVAASARQLRILEQARAL